ncbi:uncharacterized protein LOC26528017 [Drosophila mojavensis]|uniref:Uncharacterized protein n=1 Tax=Drosophila mojavensis TaxID=7230 RepID=A0A0Q9XDQ2_DROMO|nr:uncharacterized protein LOC26528017 [Drosophila mojavensis]KRG06525.1 uncharacterized protein Dmoj_GI26376 [Drosophila mojavensis]
MALSPREPNMPKKLIIDQAKIDFEEIAELLQAQPSEHVEINGNEGVKIIFRSINFNHKSADLTIYFKKKIDATVLAALPNVINISSLLLVANHKMGTLKPLFEAISSLESLKLKRLSSTSSIIFDGINSEDYDRQISPRRITTFNNEEFMALLKIKSLKIIDCQLCDLRDIEFPSQLPEIEDLSIRSFRGGSLANLLRALALQEDSKLCDLRIEEHPLSTEEISQIVKLKCLNSLKCGFADIKNLYMISKLQKLQIFGIISRHKLKEISENLLKLIMSCTRTFSIYYTDVLSVDRSMQTLTIQINETMYSEEFEPLSNFPNLLYLVINGPHAIGSLAPLLKAFANKQSTVLQEICIEMNPICHYEVLLISQIKTLKYVECQFIDPRSIKLLASLPLLRDLRIKSVNNLNDIAEGVLSVLLGCGNEVSIIREYREITYIKNVQKLKIVNASYEELVYNARDYALLAQLPPLNTLYIEGVHTLGSFTDLFQALGEVKNSALQDIQIVQSRISYTFPKPTVNIDEANAITKILTLRKLKCGFVDGDSIEVLAQLTALEELFITTHKQGSLTPFLKALSLRKSSNLRCLIVEENQLTAEETAEVSKVNSLKRLECGFDGHNIESLAQMNELEELIITSIEKEILSQLIEVLAAGGPRTLRLLNIISTPIDLSDSQFLVEIQTLDSLHCAFTHNESVELLGELRYLRDLSLHLMHHKSDNDSIKCIAQLNNLTALEIVSTEVGSLTGLLKAMSLRSNQILQSLDITENDVSPEEIREIIKINSLRRLKCGLAKKESLHYLTYLKDLEVLEITSYHDYHDISQDLLRILEVCCKLKAIDFYYGTRFACVEFISAALKVLKAVRNPIEQGPLEFRVPYFAGLTPEQSALNSEAYLKLSKFENYL